MLKYLILFILLPCLCLSQRVTSFSVKAGDTLDLKHGKGGSLLIYYIFYSDSGKPLNMINDTIMRYVFDPKKFDYSKPLKKLLQKLYKKDKHTVLTFGEYYNSKRIYSLKVDIDPVIKDRKMPLYLNYDLTTGNFISIGDLLNTKNDIFSFQQSVTTTMADSVRYFEQNQLNQLLAKGSIDKEKYGKIIEKLNDNLSAFRAHYLTDFVFTEKGLEEDFDCIVPQNIYPYDHTYKMVFPYKTLRNMMKPEYLKRLTK